MDIAELPEALSALARDLERRDDDPFTLHCHAAVLLAKRTVEERMAAEEAVRVMGGTRADLAPAHRPQKPPATLRDRLIEAADVYSEHPPIFGLFFEAADALADERRWLEQAVGHPGPPASEQEDYNPAADLSTYRDALIERLDNELRFHRELMEIRRTLLGPDHYRIGLATKDLLATRLPSATLLRLASHLLPTFAGDEAEMDSPVVDLEAFGIGREDPEAKLLLEHMNLGSGDAGWPHFPMAYVARGLSAYLLAVSKATRRAAMGMPAPAPSIGQCCPRMRTALGPHTCPIHPSPSECPDSVVGALADGRIGLRIHDGGSAVLVIAFCPWCGARLLAGAQTGHHEPRAPSIDLLGFEAALHAAKTPEEKRRVFKQSIPLAKGR